MISSSVSPSLKYSLSASALKLVNGSTAIDVSRRARSAGRETARRGRRLRAQRRHDLGAAAQAVPLADALKEPAHRSATTAGISGRESVTAGGE